MKARLAEVLPLCWEQILEMQFETLWKSMPDRVHLNIPTEPYGLRAVPRLEPARIYTNAASFCLGWVYFVPSA